MKTRALILGAGYTGKVLSQLLKEKAYAVSETNRQVFLLEDPSTWKNLPKAKICFWMFPAEPVELVQEFIQKTWGEETIRSQDLRMVVVGTTSSILVDQPDQEVDELSGINISEARVKGEEYIRSLGGIVVRAAGIYGPQRNPMDWVRKGLVGRSPKYVNFIHVEDLAQILLAAAERGRGGASYLAADSHPFRWNELIENWAHRFGLKALDIPSKRTSKRISARRSLDELGITLKFSDVLQGT